MKFISALCLSAAVVFGAAISSPSAAFGCGGSTGQTGCKSVTAPLTYDGLRFIVTLFDLFT